MARFAVGALLGFALLRAAPAPGPRPAAEGPVVPMAIVAHPAVPDARLNAGEVRRIFMMRRRFWRDGSPVRPVNLPAASPARVAFSRAVLGRPPRELADYFNDLYFHGTRPPPVLESERAVLLYVARVRGAVGYVSAATLASPEAGEVKVLLSLDAP